MLRSKGGYVYSQLNRFCILLTLESRERVTHPPQVTRQLGLIGSARVLRLATSGRVRASQNDLAEPVGNPSAAQGCDRALPRRGRIRSAAVRPMDCRFGGTASPGGHPQCACARAGSTHPRTQRDAALPFRACFAHPHRHRRAFGISNGVPPATPSERAGRKFAARNISRTRLAQSRLRLRSRQLIQKTRYVNV
jgi:hypothetical protein